MKKGKKITCIFLAVLICSLFLLRGAFAEQGGGQGGGTGSYSGGGSGDQPDYNEIGSWASDDFSAFRLMLVYVDKQLNWDIIETVVAYAPDTCTKSCGYKSQLVQEYVRRQRILHPEHNYYLRTDGIFSDLARNLTNDHNYIDHQFGWINRTGNWQKAGLYHKDEIMEIVSSNGFNVDENKLSKDNPERSRDDKHSYGYRIIIERLMIGTLHDGGWTDNFWYGYLITRRENIREYGNDMIGGSGSWDLYTTENDIGLEKVGNPGDNIELADLADKFVPGHGAGYNILWFDTSSFGKYDYDAEYYCRDCDKVNKDNIAYAVSDTSDWKAIKKVVSDSDTQKDIGPWCRESYQVMLPDASNKIYANTGRYFTLNARYDSSDPIYIPDNRSKYPIPAEVPNYGPVKVKRTTTCTSDGFNLTSICASNMSKLHAEGSTGTVKVHYKEITKGVDVKKPYEKDETELTLNRRIKTENESNNCTPSRLEQSVTYEYYMPTDIWNLIRQEDGRVKSTRSTDSDANKKNDEAVNLGVGVFPISFNNTNENAAQMTFYYYLPKNWSTMSDKLKSKSSEINKSKTYNVYNEYLNGNRSDDVMNAVREGTCAKDFGYAVGSAEFNSCAQELRKDKGKTSCASGTNNNGANYSHTCNIYASCNPGDKGCPDPCNKNNYVSMKRSWDFAKNQCCPEGTKYNPITKACIPDDSLCTSPRAADNLDRAWNPYGNNGKGVCCEIGEEFNALTKSCEKINDPGKPGNPGDSYDPNDPYKGLCPNDCENGCCPSGICAPMKTVDGHPVCPFGGRVIYRTIDLDNPFPGQNAQIRALGSNWCGRDIITNEVNCTQFGSEFSRRFILNSTTTGKQNGKKIYQKDPIYEVTLDGHAINEIRTYNKSANRTYDDFDLTCRPSGRACISRFLREKKSILNLKGKCADVPYSGEGFYQCDEYIRK